MPKRRPFRFGVFQNHAPSRDAWIDDARKFEQLGYSTLVSSDHIFFGGLAPMVALMAAAEATTTLRLATHVLANDFRNPVMLAQEAATLDLLSGGRLELGIGAGWLASDYAAAGVRFDPASERLRRLEEVVPLLKRLFGDEPVTHEGACYSIRDMNLQTKPMQRPHPPIFLGSGGKRGLSLAGREANIVGLDMKAMKGGRKDAATISRAATAQKVEWLRQAAGARCDEIELHVLCNKVVVTDDRRRGIEEVAAWLDGFPPSVVANIDSSAEAILDTPHLMVGSVDQIVEDLQARREELGISYITIAAQYAEAFGPVVERLAGT